MRHSILTALYVLFQEIFLEEVTWHVLNYIFTEVDEGLPLYPVG